MIAFNEKFLTKNIYTNSTKFPPGNATTEENPITFNINKNKGNFESMSLVKNWTDFLISLDVFKSRLSEMKKFVQKLNANLNLNTSSIYNENHENAFLPHNISTGITFDGKIVINNLNLSVFNGHDIEDLLKNSYR